jgi:dTDP-4-amino-4,6-dideoxygalactose transaminase
MRIWLSPPHLTGREGAYLQQALDSGWVAPLGPMVEGFERDIAATTGVEHVLACSSATAALHLSLLALGLGAGDLVACPSFTFVAAANAIRYTGAEPLMIGSEPRSWNMCPAALEEAITRSKRAGHPVRAIMMVHLYGMPADVDAIRRVANMHGLPVIEDAANALGSTYRGRPCGGLGDVSVLSFNGNKIITTSSGGALLSHRAELVARARYLSVQARDPALHYEHSEVGYNYRLSNLLAAVGRAQWPALAERVARRRAHFAAYRAALSDVPGVVFTEEAEGCYSNRWLSCLRLTAEGSRSASDERSPSAVCHALAAVGIEARPLWKPMHLQPAYRDCQYVGDGFEDDLFATGLCLPSGSSLTDAQRDEVIGRLKVLLG